MGKYICKICGKEFDRVGNAVYCQGPHFRPCPVCGKPVEFHRLSESVKCCSKECRDYLASQSKQHIEVCKECGKEFVANQASNVYCPGPHIAKCVVCGKDFTYTCSPKEKPHTCSRACQEVLRSQTAMSRYGVANVSQLESVKQKISHATRSEPVRQKRVATSLKRWGVTNPAKNADIRRRMSEVMKSDGYLRKRAQTCIAKYGFESPMSNPDVIAKRRATNIERYGTFGHIQTRDQLMKVMVDGSKVDEFIAFKNDPQGYIAAHYTVKPNISQLESDLGVTDTPIYNVLIEHDCSDCIARYSSSMEAEVIQYLQRILPGVEIIRNDRTLIKPQEIDIYLPQYKIGIECNPTATHNSSLSDPWGSNPKSYRYHKDKTDAASTAGIFLFHIFGYEWIHRRRVLESMLSNLLGATPLRIGARQTAVVELSDAECRRFLDQNHRQGALSAAVRLGLKFNDDIVAVMTFGRLRNSIGATKQFVDCWELSRFCNKLNTVVIGGASKLLKYFIATHDPESVVSFSDRAHTRGELYQVLGFTKVSSTDPNYVWVKKNDLAYYNRVRCQKQFLRQLLHDNTIDLTHTEREIMESHGFVRVYDSGVIRWELRLKT